VASGRGREVPGTRAYGARLGRVVSRTLAPLPTDTRCLAQSLVLTRLLARRGVRASVVIAVASEPEFQAHAWVEYENQPLLAAAGDSFKRLLEF
jgi:hypothetical protein